MALFHCFWCQIGSFFSCWPLFHFVIRIFVRISDVMSDTLHVLSDFHGFISLENIRSSIGRTDPLNNLAEILGKLLRNPSNISSSCRFGRGFNVNGIVYGIYFWISLSWWGKISGNSRHWALQGVSQTLSFRVFTQGCSNFFQQTQAVRRRISMFSVDSIAEPHRKSFQYANPKCLSYSEFQMNCPRSSVGSIYYQGICRSYNKITETIPMSLYWYNLIN